jgi:predicted GH43/DUF377 family glycosyl hydrolase
VIKVTITINSLICFCYIFTTGVLAQTEWNKYDGNPILDVGDPGSFDATALGYPVVILKDSKYHMWYNGHAFASWEQVKVGYATSVDGVNWKKYDGKPINLNPGAPGSWDDNLAVTGPVICEGDTFKMWYVGKDGTTYRAGYATSTDGINWNKHPDPVLNIGETGTWDDVHVYPRSVIFDGEIYKMWYGGDDGNKRRIGYATSSDGIEWVKLEGKNPVLIEGNSNDFDQNGVQDPVVINDGIKYHIWYNGRNYDGGYAWSHDGIIWNKHEQKNPVIEHGSPRSWDANALMVGCVLLQDSIFKMYYYANDYQKQCIGLATDSTLAPSSKKEHILINDYTLKQNYPNPFNPSTQISFTIPKHENVTLEVYNLIGQKIETLLNKPLSAGIHEVEFNAHNLSSGIYMYRIEAGAWQDVKKMVLLH